MPRSIRDILDQADELAARFENYEPQPDDERPVEEHLLERAALARARSERQIVDAIIAARTKNVPWTRIGELLGTSAGTGRAACVDVCPGPSLVVAIRTGRQRRRIVGG